MKTRHAKTPAARPAKEKTRAQAGNPNRGMTVDWRDGGKWSSVAELLDKSATEYRTYLAVDGVVEEDECNRHLVASDIYLHLATIPAMRDWNDGLAAIKWMIEDIKEMALYVPDATNTHVHLRFLTQLYAKGSEAHFAELRAERGRQEARHDPR